MENDKRSEDQLSGSPAKNNSFATEILVVEDNEVNQKVMSVLLELFGLKADLAKNGFEAVEAVKNKDYSVILMDCHMPGMDGFEATAEIRKYQESLGKYTPIIAVTALAMAGDRQRCIAAGMDDYLSKPIDREVLKQKISYWTRTDVLFKNKNVRQRRGTVDSRYLVEGLPPVDLEHLEEIYNPSALENFLEIFVTTSDIRMYCIRESLDKKDVRVVTSMAHELKASALSLGSKHLAKLCLYLEQAAGQEDWMEAEHTFDAIGEVYDRVKAYLKSISPAYQSDRP